MIVQPAVESVLDILGVFAFAVSGGLVAVAKRLDLFGVVVLAGITALGGGVVRDLCIGAIPPAAMSDWPLLMTALVAAILTFWWSPAFVRISRLVALLDAAGLGAFVIAGAIKALDYGAGPLVAVLVGVITAIGGGMMRDVLVREIPAVLHRELYAVPAALGAVLFVVLHELGLYDAWVPAVCALLVVGLRLAAIVYRLDAPYPKHSRLEEGPV